MIIVYLSCPFQTVNASCLGPWRHHIATIVQTGQKPDLLPLEDSKGDRDPW